jgi:hypothetical protein
MGVVIEDVAAARNLPAPEPGSHSAEAYAARQRVKRAGFVELRNALVGFGGLLTAQFLQLDKEIEDFAEQFITTTNPATGYQYRMASMPASGTARSHQAASGGIAGRNRAVDKDLLRDS